MAPSQSHDAHEQLHGAFFPCTRLATTAIPWCCPAHLLSTAQEPVLTTYVKIACGVSYIGIYAKSCYDGFRIMQGQISIGPYLNRRVPRYAGVTLAGP